MGVQLKSHQPCPDCNSSDALTVYDWGTKCYSCNKATFSEHKQTMKVISGNDSFKKVDGISKTIIDRKITRQTCEHYGVVEAEGY